MKPHVRRLVPWLCSLLIVLGGEWGHVSLGGACNDACEGACGACDSRASCCSGRDEQPMLVAGCGCGHEGPLHLSLPHSEPCSLPAEATGLGPAECSGFLTERRSAHPAGRTPRPELPPPKRLG
jgi:hypothetical protein